MGLYSTYIQQNFTRKDNLSLDTNCYKTKTERQTNCFKRNNKKKLYLSVIKNLQHGSPLGQSRPGFIMRNLIWKEYEALQKKYTKA